MNAVSGALQDAVGKAYVDKYFPASAKARIQAMVDDIKAAFARRVQAIDWLAPSTKAGGAEEGRDHRRRRRLSRALARLLLTGRSATTPTPTEECRSVRYRHQIAKIGKPMDRGEWWMPPQLVNAVNLPVQNALNFPAAILQRPFFDPQADAAFNYGAIGGRSVTRSATASTNTARCSIRPAACGTGGRRSDFQRFQQAGQALAAQFDAYEALPGLHVNGQLTLGENIADVAGLAAAYDAYRRSLGGKEAPVIQGFSGDQRFFIAYAQSWASKMRDATLRQRIATDGHAPDSSARRPCATSTRGTPPSTCSRARNSICRPTSACGSGSEAITSDRRAV